MRAPGVARCVALVIVAAATFSMVEPIGSLYLSSLGVTPARVGLVFGAGRWPTRCSTRSTAVSATASGRER